MFVAIRSRSSHRRFLTLLTLATLPLVASENSGLLNGTSDQRISSQGAVRLVLYEGPLMHDKNWKIARGPKGPDNFKLAALGGTCSTVPADIFNAAAFERITFDAVQQHLGMWKMSWVDTVSGEATQGADYKYQRRMDFSGTTKNGAPPRPKRISAFDDDEQGLQVVPSNVLAPAVDIDDVFILSSHGILVASSYVRGTFRLQIPPIDQDPPPAAFPVILPGGYILQTIQQLAGQTGCDPL